MSFVLVRGQLRIVLVIGPCTVSVVCVVCVFVCVCSWSAIGQFSVLLCLVLLLIGQFFDIFCSCSPSPGGGSRRGLLRGGARAGEKACASHEASVDSRGHRRFTGN